MHLETSVRLNSPNLPCKQNGDKTPQVFAQHFVEQYFVSTTRLSLPALSGRNWRNFLDVPTVGRWEMVPNAPKNLCRRGS